MLAILYIELSMKKGHVMTLEFGLCEEAEKKTKSTEKRSCVLKEKSNNRKKEIA
jgi:hypothetical protein